MHRESKSPAVHIVFCLIVSTFDSCLANRFRAEIVG